MMFIFWNLVAQATPDVGAVLSEGGLYGVISILGLTTVAGWTGFVRQLLRKGDDVLKVHQEYSGKDGILEAKGQQWRSEFKEQHDKNTANWERAADALTVLNHTNDKMLDKQTELLALIRARNN